jgi:hypothetical protein
MGGELLTPPNAAVEVDCSRQQERRWQWKRNSMVRSTGCAGTHLNLADELVIKGNFEWFHATTLDL